MLKEMASEQSSGTWKEDEMADLRDIDDTG